MYEGMIGYIAMMWMQVSRSNMEHNELGLKSSKLTAA